MFKYYLYAAFFAAMLVSIPVTIVVYKLEKSKNEEIFYTPLIFIILFAIIFLYTLANKITYIGEFF